MATAMNVTVGPWAGANVLAEAHALRAAMLAETEALCEDWLAEADEEAQAILARADAKAAEIIAAALATPPATPEPVAAPIEAVPAARAQGGLFDRLRRRLRR